MRRIAEGFIRLGKNDSQMCGAGVSPAFLRRLGPEKSPARRRRHGNPRTAGHYRVYRAGVGPSSKRWRSQMAPSRE